MKAFLEREKVIAETKKVLKKPSPK